MALEERIRMIQRNGESELKQKFSPWPAEIMTLKRTLLSLTALITTKQLGYGASNMVH